MERYDTNPIVEIFIKVNDIITNLPYEKDFYIQLKITTIDGNLTKLELSNNKDKSIDITKNIIVYDNVAISLNDIVKINISGDNLIKNELMMELKTTNIYNSRYACNTNYQRRYNRKMNNRNIEDYIRENYKNIDSINFNSIQYNDYIKEYSNINKENVLSDKTYLDVKKGEVLSSVNLDTQETEVINFIEICNEDIISKIDIEEKSILTKNAKEVEVAKPIQTKPINVTTDIDVKDFNIVVNQSSTTAIKDIKENQSDVVKNISPTYVDSVLGNINIKEQLIKPQTIDILYLEPFNEYIDKNELNSKPLRLDPTGERYIGVVLDDGTFEPLKISQKTITIIDGEVNNLLGNIDNKNQIDKVVKDVEHSKESMIKSLDIKYTEGIVEYKTENLRSIKDVINIKHDIVNSITNEEDTVYVVTKEETEVINSIKNIDNKPIMQINDIETTPVIKAVEIISNSKDVVEENKLKKENVNVVKDIESVENKNIISSKELIKGSIEYVNDGIMIVDNGDLDITIYSISKINSVNL